MSKVVIDSIRLKDGETIKNFEFEMEQDNPTNEEINAALVKELDRRFGTKENDA